MERKRKENSNNREREREKEKREKKQQRNIYSSVKKLWNRQEKTSCKQFNEGGLLITTTVNTVKSIYSRIV